jgi:hypothetical protein
MCFSAEASFAGGVIISAIGIATVTKVHKSSQIVFASIPLFFGIQQMVEGSLWLTIPLPEYGTLQKVGTYLFLIMADVLWPTIIPMSVLLMEDKLKSKKVLLVLLGMGITLSLYYAFCLFNFEVMPEIRGYHIHYDTTFPKFLSMPAFIIYLIVTITPLFISSIKRTHLMGVLMFLSCLVTAIFFTQYLTSVWCFFAALLSGVIFWILKDSKSLYKITLFNTLRASVVKKA